MNRRTMMVGWIAGLVGHSTRARAETQTSPASLRSIVESAERGFASTVARRDLAAFPSYISEEAVFFSGEGTAGILRGRRAIVDTWKRYFDGPDAPFSWEPDLVEVIESGTLALTSGPVRNPKGEITGRFNSIWRREADGGWRVVFDRGSAACTRG